LENDVFFNLVFDKSGDTILCKSCNDEFVEFYVDWLNTNAFNKFYCLKTNPTSTIDQGLMGLQEVLLTHYYLDLEQLSRYKFPILELEQYLDQKVLNDYHARWTKAHKQVVDITKLRALENKTKIIRKICDIYSDDIETQEFISVTHRLGLRNLYENINTQIHLIEKGITEKRTYSNGTTEFLDNPMEKNILDYTPANLRVSPEHLGRSMYDKFFLFDENFEADDENTFDQITNRVIFGLDKYEEKLPSTQYLEWCSKNHKEPVGEYLNLGNIVDLDKHLLKHRQVLYKNLKQNQNFTIEIK
jgi:hypothetical protein